MKLLNPLNLYLFFIFKNIYISRKKKKKGTVS